MSIDKKYVYTVLEAVAKAKNKKERLEILQSNVSGALLGILRGSFDESLEFALPEGEPPYTPFDFKDDSKPIPLESYLPQFPKFIKRQGKQVPTHLREGTFIKVLQSIHPEDAKLMLAMKDKNLKVKGLTLKVVKDAFPDLIK